MTTRRVSREPYRIRRDRREVLTAIAVAVAIVAVTVILVWIFAPGDDSTSTPTAPTFNVPTSEATTSLPADTTPTTAPGG